jgi:predicted Zn-dependent protease
LSILRLILAAIIGFFSVFSYCSTTSDNPVTGETQRVDLTYAQEALLGREAAPHLLEQFGGPANAPGSQALLDEVGQDVAEPVSKLLPYEFEFTLLDSPDVVNAFALPGGQVFLTTGLYSRFDSEGQLAGVLAHEVGHIAARHAAEQIAKAKLTQGLTGAAVVASYDPSNPTSAERAQMAMLLGELVTMKFGREDELEADRLAVRLMTEAGYNPESLVEVMTVLEQANQNGNGPAFLSTHPSPRNRVAEIRKAIDALYPKGASQGAGLLDQDSLKKRPNLARVPVGSHSTSD